MLQNINKKSYIKERLKYQGTTVVVVCPLELKMTMTSGSLLSLFVCPEVADKADPGVKPTSE